MCGLPRFYKGSLFCGELYVMMIEQGGVPSYHVSITTQNDVVKERPIHQWEQGWLSYYPNYY